MGGHKVLLVTNIPTPYRIPLLNELHEQLGILGLELKVVFGAFGYARRRWEVDMSECKFEYVVLQDRGINYADPERISFTYPRLYRLTLNENPSVIISNGFSIATTKLWVRSFYKRTPYMIWSGAINGEARRGFFLRKLQRKAVISRAIGFIAYGTRAKQYLTSMGAPDDRVTVAINTVNTRFYARVSELFRQKLTYRNKKRHLLYVGHLSLRKNVVKVLAVTKALSKQRHDLKLDIVGDGEDRGRLLRYIEDEDLRDVVRIHGFKQSCDVARFLARSDCFLFQTDFDIWGLALVEAMAGGVPSIASVHAGATQDLIEDGATGFAMDFSETEKVADKVNWILENPEAAERIGKRACRFIQENVTVEKSARGFVRAIEAVLEDND